MYANKTLKRYLDDLAVRLPAPGGGSASALNAALASGLVSMVVNFTLGKPKYADYEEELKGILEKSEKLRQEFLRLVDLDIAAYKSKNVQDMLDVPFMLARLCFEGMKLCVPLVKKGNINLISDVAVAAIFFESAFSAAYFNVEINLRSFARHTVGLQDDQPEKNFPTDQAVKAIRKELSHKDRMIKKMRVKLEEQIGGIIRG